MSSIVPIVAQSHLCLVGGVAAVEWGERGQLNPRDPRRGQPWRWPCEPTNDWLTKWVGRSQSTRDHGGWPSSRQTVGRIIAFRFVPSLLFAFPSPCLLRARIENQDQSRFVSRGPLRVCPCGGQSPQRPPRTPLADRCLPCVVGPAAAPTAPARQSRKVSHQLLGSDARVVTPMSRSVTQGWATTRKNQKRGGSLMRSSAGTRCGAMCSPLFHICRRADDPGHCRLVVRASRLALVPD